MFNINRSIVISVITMVVILMFTLSYMSDRIPNVKNDSVSTVNLNNEKWIGQLEKQIVDLEYRITTLENEVDSLKNITVPPTIKPTITPTPEPTVIPTKNITIKQEKIEPVKPNNKSSSKNSKVNNVTSTRNAVYQKVNNDINKKSGLTPSEINKLLGHIKDTRYNQNSNYRLLDKGEVFTDMENQYEVNTLYAISVAITETSMGTAGVGRQNNLFAFINNNGSGYRVYGSVDDSIMEFGKSARRYYFDKSLTTVNEIAPVYCPPNSTKWSNTVNWLISHYADNMNKILQN